MGQAALPPATSFPLPEEARLSRLLSLLVSICPSGQDRSSACWLRIVCVCLAALALPRSIDCSQHRLCLPVSRLRRAKPGSPLPCLWHSGSIPPVRGRRCWSKGRAQGLTGHRADAAAPLPATGGGEPGPGAGAGTAAGRRTGRLCSRDRSTGHTGGFVKSGRDVVSSATVSLRIR